jgi:hypothetical protein
MDDNSKATLQIIWGLLLVMAGVGVFFRIPQVMPKIRQIPSLDAALPFIYFCFYFMAVILIGGGARKLYLNLRVLSSKTPRRK